MRLCLFRGDAKMEHGGRGLEKDGWGARGCSRSANGFLQRWRLATALVAGGAPCPWRLCLSLRSYVWWLMTEPVRNPSISPPSPRRLRSSCPSNVPWWHGDIVQPAVAGCHYHCKGSLAITPVALIMQSFIHSFSLGFPVRIRGGLLALVDLPAAQTWKMLIAGWCLEQVVRSEIPVCKELADSWIWRPNLE